MKSGLGSVLKRVLVRVPGNALPSVQLSKLGMVQLSVLGNVLGSVQSSAFDKCTICSVMYSIVSSADICLCIIVI
jgi:hypothetical protein